MKKLLVGLLLLIVAVSCFAQTPVTVGDRVIVEWDAVTKFADGTAFPAGDVIEYEVYRAPYPTGTPLTLVGSGAALEREVIFPAEGAYLIGVRTKRTSAGLVSYSAVAWCYVVGYPAPWYAVYVKVAATPARVRLR